MTNKPNLISAGTQVVALVEINGPVRVESHRDHLLAVKRGEVPWPEVNSWRLDLHHDFERALDQTKLPERPDYEAANDFLRKEKREMTLIFKAQT